jgi:hypothetical protein
VGSWAPVAASRCASSAGDAYPQAIRSASRTLRCGAIPRSKPRPASLSARRRAPHDGRVDHPDSAEHRGGAFGHLAVERPIVRTHGHRHRGGRGAGHDVRQQSKAIPLALAQGSSPATEGWPCTRQLLE